MPLSLAEQFRGQVSQFHMMKRIEASPPCRRHLRPEDMPTPATAATTPATAAATPTPAAAIAKKARTIAAMDAEARALFKRRTDARAAAIWAHENDVGSRKACSSGKFGNVTYNMVEPLLRELEQYGSIADDRDHAKQILTNDERRKLAQWILACADGHNPKDRTQLSAKVRQMLKARHASNKKKRWRAGSLRLNPQEVAAADSKEPRLSNNFFERFYPWLGWKRCPTCGPKKGLCKVRACAAARKPLLLGYNPAAEALEGAEGAA